MPVTINGDGSITGLSVGGLGSGVVDTSTIADGAVTGIKHGAGSIIQVVQTVKTDTDSTSSKTFSNISGLSVNITPISSSNKVLLIADLSFGGPITNTHAIRFSRGATAIYIADVASNRIRGSISLGGVGGYNYEQRTLQKTFLESPNTTSEVSYHIQWRIGNSGTFWLNKSARDTDLADYDGRSASSFTLMEVAA